ncbi:MAG: thymidylate synthase [Ignavibacterium sp.]|nr:MAG: thymidylate synthase [Ignavibacterium sp.]
MDKYLTIEEVFIDEISVKDSKFIAYLYPISSKEDFDKILKSLWKEHHKARHICYAYQLDDKTFHYYDNGEPSGTAGLRICSAIKIKNLNYAALFVVRYFGGTKLGTGPLAKAYFDASMKVLNKAKIVEKYFTVTFLIKLPYNQFERLKKILLEFTPYELKPIYTENIELKISVKEDLVEKFKILMKENGIETSLISSQ